MAFRIGKRWLWGLSTGVLVLALAGALFWWLGYVPYDAMAVYRPLPRQAVWVERHLDLAGQWEGLQQNPVIAHLLEMAGIAPADAAALAQDEESRKWFQRLAGNEGVIACVPRGKTGGHDWVAVSWLGREEFILRMQLLLFRVPGYRRLSDTPVERPVWEVQQDWLRYPEKLYISFLPGRIVAAVSRTPEILFEMLETDAGRQAGLLAGSPSFARFAEEDLRDCVNQAWGIPPFLPAPATLTFTANAETLDFSFNSNGGIFKGLPENRIAPAATDELVRRIGNSAAVVVALQAEILPWFAAQADWDMETRHLLEVAGLLVDDHLFAFLLDGDMSGRLSLGGMAALGPGLRVPTLLLATRPGDSREALDQRILAAMRLNNAHYRGAFLFRRLEYPHGAMYVLESRNQDEWVDYLALDDRPAYAVTDGWLLFASNLSALRTLLAQNTEQPAPPAWAAIRAAEGAATVWVDFPRMDRLLRDGIGLWNLSRGLMGLRADPLEQEILAAARTWSARLQAFGTGQAGIGGDAGSRAWGAAHLGLPEAP